MTRARLAWDAYNKQHGVCPDYSVGGEGGILRTDNKMECFACLVIYNGSHFGMAKAASFPLPEAIRKQVLNGMELGHANDAVFSTINSKQAGGVVGSLTKGVPSRKY